MKTGIVGFAGAGKTTVFNSLTGLDADTGYSGKNKANLGLIKVPDARVDRLTEIYAPKKTTYAEVAFVDVAGPQGADSTKGLASGIIEQIQQSDALVHVIRAFDDAGASRPADALRDLQEFEGDLILSDLIKVENRIERLGREGKHASSEMTLMHRLHEQLDSNRALRLLSFSESESQLTSGYQFMSLKPCLALINCGDDAIGEPVSAELEAAVEAADVGMLSMSARTEAEISRLDDADQAEFLADLGLESSARNRFINAAYTMLDLISFLTSGPDECRAWTIRRSTSARSAAGQVHSDIERGFIRAEVIAFDDFDALGSEAKCREAGKLRLEGKEYEVCDGDIINFRFNV